MQLSGRKTWISMTLAAAVLAGCSSTSVTRAPVEDRGLGTPALVGTVDPATLPLSLIHISEPTRPY